jgi:hypothetical protein
MAVAKSFLIDFSAPSRQVGTSVEMTMGHFYEAGDFYKANHRRIEKAGFKKPAFSTYLRKNSNQIHFVLVVRTSRLYPCQTRKRPRQSDIQR